MVIKKIKKMDDPRPAIGQHPVVLVVQGHRWILIIRVIIIIIRRLFHLWRNDIQELSSIRKRLDLSHRKWMSIRHFLVMIAALPQHPASIERMKMVTIITNSTLKPVPFTVATPKAITPRSTLTVASKLSRFLKLNLNLILI